MYNYRTQDDVQGMSCRHLPDSTGQLQKAAGLFQDQVLNQAVGVNLSRFEDE